MPEYSSSQTSIFVGDEFQVNTYWENYQYEQVVTPLEGGGFVVVWVSNEQDGDNRGVFGQVFDASGAPVGSEFAVNETTYQQQTDPKVTALAGGGFAIVVLPH